MMNLRLREHKKKLAQGHTASKIKQGETQKELMGTFQNNVVTWKSDFEL